MFRFLLAPKWIALTLIAIFLQPAFWELSQWQWHRLHEREISNSIVTANQKQEPVPIEEIISDSDGSASVDASYQWRVVDIVGHWLNEKEVLVRKQSYESNLGFWVITPFKSTSGLTVLVNRGWVAATGSALDSPAVEPAPVTVAEILGRIRIAPNRSGTAPSDLPQGQVDRIVPDELLPDFYRLSNAYLELTASTPESRGTSMEPILPPEISEGPHRSYAIQWILFAIMTLIGWGILVRKELQDRNNSSAS
ncbi:MAG: SURF1 family protein [Actinomycetales bacterium]|nr:SURF1 family protein [Actinomycetales bacterium]